MSERLTKNAARNIFYGGTAFFFIIFVALVAQSHSYVLEKSSNNDRLSEGVVRGKAVWEENSCINCHTLMGEGAYFAPELGNVWFRYGGADDPEGAREGLMAWIKSMPSGIEGRRQMPHFNLTDQQLNDLVDFLRFTAEVDTQGWPPTVSG